jgi:hypothetical protein
MRSLDIQLRPRNRLPRFDGEAYKMMRFGPELRHNRDVQKFVYDEQEYGCFFANRIPTIQEIIPLKSLEGGRYVAYYFLCLEYDEGSPYSQVLFILVDTAKRRFYESWMIGRAAECRVVCDRENSFAFDFCVGDNPDPIYCDMFEIKLGAAMQCAMEAFPNDV